MAKNRVEICLYVADAAWNLFLLFPVFVAYWSGTWGIIDMYAEKWFPNNEIFGCFICIFIGSFLLIESYFVIPLLKIFVNVSRPSVKHFVVSRTSIYVCSFGALFYWRGAWNITVILMGSSLETAIAVTVIALMLLVLLRSSANPIGSPFSLSLDLRRNFYAVWPRFRQTSDNLYIYTLDVLFSVYVITTLNVIVWVGLWRLGDVLILPDDPRLSMIVSLGAGAGSSVVIFALWLPLDAAVVYVSTEVSALLAAVVQAVVNVVQTVVVLLLWRGLWGLMIERLADASNALQLAWICHAIGFIAMVVLHVSSTFGVVGVAVDGDRSFRDWPMEYFVVYYRLRRDQRNADRTRISSDTESLLEGNDDLEPVESSVVINETLPSAQI